MAAMRQSSLFRCKVLFRSRTSCMNDGAGVRVERVWGISDVHLKPRREPTFWSRAILAQMTAAAMIYSSIPRASSVKSAAGRQLHRSPTRARRPPSSCLPLTNLVCNQLSPLELNNLLLAIRRVEYERRFPIGKEIG